MHKYINLDYLNEVSGGDENVKKQIIEMFLTQMSEVSETLKTALKNSDYKTLSETAHLAKSSLRIMGIEDIALKMETLQQTAAQNEKRENYPALINYFLERIPLAEKELQEEIS